MGRVSEVSIPQASLARQFLISRFRCSSLFTRILLILLILALLHAQYLYFLYRDELGAKYSATTFPTSDSLLWETGSADSELPRSLLAHREKWTVLGSGWEGNTFTFNGSVIKTFTPGRSPFRNCAVRQPSARWPTEIPASLTFGGAWKPADTATGNNLVDANHTSSGFLPVQAHFVAASSEKKAPEWHLVTPFLLAGNLNRLAKSLQEKHPYKHFRDVDSAYRPVFNRLLRTLDHLHARGFCHDDIKPSNIFVESDTHWILGDLGNVRHLSHPYHSSRLWVRDNNQLPDCRANDVLRALKSYLQFLRAASNDPAGFDTAFFEAKESFSRLFWWTLDHASHMSAVQLRVLSEAGNPERTASTLPSDEICPHHISPFLVGRKRALSNAVDEALRTNFREGAARWAAMSWLFGIPVERC